MIQVWCSRCGRELCRPGAVAFSPPSHGAAVCRKYHLCSKCWKAFLRFVKL